MTLEGHEESNVSAGSLRDLLEHSVAAPVRAFSEEQLLEYLRQRLPFLSF